MEKGKEIALFFVNFIPGARFPVPENKCMRRFPLVILSVSLLAGTVLTYSFSSPRDVSPVNYTDSARVPKMVNIVNFIRLLEPRDSSITEDRLYQTVVNQVNLLKKHRLRATFLLQYDALMDKRYQQLLKSLPRDSFEIGAWCEIPQPLVEKAGLKWRGKYPWDWRANIGFSTGYDPAEREKLADVYMAGFKSVLGYYPKSVGSWFIDAHTLGYLYRKYGIVASCNCKDQYGTDGYTLWGGYWNQAYYPSRINSYMPAQHEAEQIPVPIFRMLGSDPVRQYDDQLGKARQGVITLEPVYPRAGGDSVWIDWYFRELVNGPAVAFGYTQAGQENSFTWEAMARGLELQFPLIEKLRDEGRIWLPTLAESGTWFRKQFKVTPATAVTVTEDLPGSDKQTVWFDSRFYRANLLWSDSTLKFRDIHLFDERFPSVYEDRKADSDECRFFTLPLVDGFLWSTPGKRAGLELRISVNGKNRLLKGGRAVFDDSRPGLLHISWPLTDTGGSIDITMDEKKISIRLKTDHPVDWFLELNKASTLPLPFTAIQPRQIEAAFQGTGYSVGLLSGRFSAGSYGSVFRVQPENGSVVLDLAEGR